MSQVTLKLRIEETDVLCIGGGIAGLMAAIRAAELGAKVIVAEKGNAKYSGAGATGNDHFMCYIPEYHGTDFNAWIQEFQTGQQAALRDKAFLTTWLRLSKDMVDLWDDWGIPMKYNGRYEFAGHGMPGDMLTHIHYAGKDQKKILTREAVKRGATIRNRVMCFDLLADDHGVHGAIGLNTREDELVVIRAKAVILGTGSAIRLYPGPTPAWMFNTRLSPNCVGDGRAMAFRAGAELASMEMPVFRCGPVYFARAGKATWAGVLRDSYGVPVGPFVTKPDNKYGDPVVDVYQDIFLDYKESGRGPVYMDCNGLTQDELDYMIHWLENEGNKALTDYLRQEGLDLRNTPIEFRSYENELFPRGGVFYNEQAETNVKGLFAAGDEFFGGISCAAVFGWVAGEQSAALSKDTPLISTPLQDEKIDGIKRTLETIRNRTAGSGSSNWKEANVAVQQVMGDFAGRVRSATLLTAGMTALENIRKRATESLAAPNAHELMRCAEILNLMEVGQLVFITAMARKETRGKHVRKDFPFTHPHYSKHLIVKRINEDTVTEWRSIKR